MAYATVARASASAESGLQQQGQPRSQHSQHEYSPQHTPSSSLAALDACSYGAHDSLPVASVTTTASAYSPHHNRFRLCSRLLSGYVTRVNYPNKTSGTKLKRERENLHNIRMHIKI